MKDLEQLVQYLDGDLNDYDRQQLTEKMRVDASLREKLDFIKDVDRVIGDNELSSFEECLNDVENSFFNRQTLEEPKPAYKFKRTYIMRAAAVAAIVVATALTFILIQDRLIYSHDKIFASYYEKMPVDFATRSNEIFKDDFTDAIKYYNQNNYKEAIIHFEKVLKKDPTNNAAKLFLGICYTETKQYKNAAGQFHTIIQQKDPIFEEHASWYLSLCYIKTDNPKLAKNILHNLVNTHSFYTAKASELLKQLH